MNERIKELAAKTGIYGAVDINGNYDNEAEVKKFAELMVRECMNIADGQKKYVEEMEVYNLQDEVWNRARIQQSEQIVDKIKQHFGVK
jgi:predicted DNA-binding protein